MLVESRLLVTTIFAKLQPVAMGPRVRGDDNDERLA